MHAFLTDASVHVPVDVLTPPAERCEPTYDEIAERALELYGAPPDAVARVLAEWVSAEGQRRRRGQADR